MERRTGREARIPYSLSRWTDVPAAKWEWFRSALDEGEMAAFHPRQSVPCRWGLRPEDVLALVFWTKDPRNLLRDREVLRPFDTHVHLTLTGWSEVEKGTPSLDQGTALLAETARAFGLSRVTWRFSPVPLLPPAEVARRFMVIAQEASRVGLQRTILSFLHENDRLPETRSSAEKRSLLNDLTSIGGDLGLRVELCRADAPVEAWGACGVCVPPEDFGEGVVDERCGCAYMVDPFTVTESCTLGCLYCYAADEQLSKAKKNTTRRLPVLR